MIVASKEIAFFLAFWATNKVIWHWVNAPRVFNLVFERTRSIDYHMVKVDMFKLAHFSPSLMSHFTVHPDDMDRPSERIRRSRSDAIHWCHVYYITPRGAFLGEKIFRTDQIFPPKYFEGILGTNFRAIFVSILIPFARVLLPRRGKMLQ